MVSCTVGGGRDAEEGTTPVGIGGAGIPGRGLAVDGLPIEGGDSVMGISSFAVLGMA